MNIRTHKGNNLYDILKKTVMSGGLALVLFVFVMVYGCRSENDIPDMYIDQRSETLMNGENVIRKQYLDAVEICRSMGKKISGLPEDEVKKLGVSRYQLAITGNKVATRKESWGFRMTGHYHHPGECRFALVYSGDLTVKVPGKTVVYDLDEKKVTKEEQGIPEAFMLPFRPLSETPGAGQEEQQGISGMKRSEGEMYGQPTVTWTRPAGNTEVLWSGGRQWGFSEFPSDSTFAVPGSMVLEKVQKKDHFTIRVKTHRFTVGEPVDQVPFSIPHRPDIHP
ncbi:hypothetical protein LS482_05935 [Sinomicrobium kalidii]|uniref:hypothetical protein n=1 Tax=Sinomicrobium kalidii TaxID=2900738 RepID=UPI001E5D421C|nr:hypothetical protein [Sinomicrobium kalidii]UGU17410.1 hypothetical protein LS482_05935 [Sinomicrobium kalidii]